MTANAFLEWYTGNPVILTGYNTALNTTFEFIGPLSLPWVESLTAGSQQHQFIPEDTLIVASASASDEASAGVGMRTMMLVGCDSRGKIISETISLNGNTSVATTKKYRLIYCAHGMTYGTTGCNVGIIYIGNKASTNTAGVLSIPAATLVINIGSVASAGQNMACNPCFMVPPGEKYGQAQPSASLSCRYALERRKSHRRRSADGMTLNAFRSGHSDRTCIRPTSYLTRAISSDSTHWLRPQVLYQ
jgi:hypothetical protein